MTIQLGWRYKSVSCWCGKSRRYTASILDTSSGRIIWTSPPKRSRELAAAELVGWIMSHNGDASERRCDGKLPAVGETAEASQA